MPKSRTYIMTVCIESGVHKQWNMINFNCDLSSLK